MDERSELKSSLEKNDYFMNELLKSLQQSENRTLVLTLHNEDDFPEVVRENATIITYDSIKNSKKRRDLIENAGEFMQICNMSVSKKGTLYLYDCILLIWEYREENIAITKDIYPEVAKRNRTSVSVVESAIRSAIKVAWETEAADAPNGIHAKFGERPSNLKFIRYLCEYIGIRSL